MRIKNDRYYEINSHREGRNNKEIGGCLVNNKNTEERRRTWIKKEKRERKGS
jgi:hypothetical protein